MYTEGKSKFAYQLEKKGYEMKNIEEIKTFIHTQNNQQTRRN